MFTIIYDLNVVKVSFERFVEIIDEELAKGHHLTAAKMFGPYAFMVCYW